jgi:hypothetical protein
MVEFACVRAEKMLEEQRWKQLYVREVVDGEGKKNYP